MPPRRCQKSPAVKVELPPLEPAKEEYAVNACHYAKVQEALTIIENTPGMSGIREEAPLPVEEGAAVSPFDQEAFRAKLKKGDAYLCGATIYFTNPLRDSSPGVPIDSKQVTMYMEHNFMDVDNIKLPQVQIGCDNGGGDMQRVSPTEPIHALILAAAKACADATAGSLDSVSAGEVIWKWKKILRSLPTTIKVIQGENMRFFASVQNRIDATVEAAAVGRQPIQWAAEIVLHRDRLWRQQGGRVPPGAEKVSQSLTANLNFRGMQNQTAVGAFSEKLSTNFVDNCITVHERLIQYPELVRLVLKYPNVWDKLNKLHVLVYKAGNKQNILWTLEMLDDMITSGILKPEEISGRSLKGFDSGSKSDKGFVAFIIAKRACKDHLMQHAQSTWAGWQPDAFVKMKEVFSSAPIFRQEMKSLAWQRPFKKSTIRFLEILEGLMLGEAYDEQLRVQVNNSRSPAEYHVNMSDLKKDLADVQTLYDEEIEVAAPPQTLPAASQDNTEQAPPAEPAAASEEVSSMQKMLSAMYPKVPFAALGPYIIAAERRIKRISRRRAPPYTFSNSVFVKMVTFQIFTDGQSPKFHMSRFSTFRKIVMIAAFHVA